MVIRWSGPHGDALGDASITRVVRGEIHGRAARLARVTCPASPRHAHGGYGRQHTPQDHRGFTIRLQTVEPVF